MDLHLLCVSKPVKGWVKTACNDYEKRLGGHFKNQLKFQVREIQPVTQDVGRKEKEAERLLVATPKNCLKVVLDEHGKHLSSVQLAEQITSWRDQANNVVCYIGGADGLSKDLIDSADLNWSISKFTLPHQVVRLVFTEQIYRAVSMINNHPYHRV